MRDFSYEIMPTIALIFLTAGHLLRWRTDHPDSTANGCKVLRTGTQAKEFLRDNNLNPDDIYLFDFTQRYGNEGELTDYGRRVVGSTKRQRWFSLGEGRARPCTRSDMTQTSSSWPAAAPAGGGDGGEVSPDLRCR